MLIKKQKQKTPPIKKPCLLTSASVINFKTATTQIHDAHIDGIKHNGLITTNL